VSVCVAVVECRLPYRELTTAGESAAMDDRLTHDRVVSPAEIGGKGRGPSIRSAQLTATLSSHPLHFVARLS
jgi:hypothetical protein